MWVADEVQQTARVAVMNEYSEAADFEHHEREVEDFLRTIDQLGISVEPKAKVLDLGAGHGMHAGFLCQHFAHVHCADVICYSSLYDGEFLKLLDEKHRRNHRSFDLSKVSFLQTDAQELIYRDDSFDFVFTVNTFEHIPDPKIALDEIIRVLKPGGYAYISFDPIWTADTGSHYSHLVPEPWAHLVLAEDEFIQRMRDAGADENQVREFGFAMNRKSLAYFQNLFDKLEGIRVTVVSRESWSGVVLAENETHDNFSLALERGYTREELLIRGLRYVTRKAVSQ
jgi:ubiquinone/menaquinone biosynthesis C-methylase UbiE